MKNTVLLYPILFEAEDTTNLDLGKDVADALKTTLGPDIDQMKKDIEVIQKASGERKQEPTNARSTTGPEQTSAATTKSKGPGTISPSSTTGTSEKNQPNVAQELIKNQQFTNAIADKVADRVSTKLNKKD